MNRRGFLGGILAAGVAPSFIGSSILMPVRKVSAPTLWMPEIVIWPRHEYHAGVILKITNHSNSPLTIEQIGIIDEMVPIPHEKLSHGDEAMFMLSNNLPRIWAKI